MKTKCAIIVDPAPCTLPYYFLINQLKETNKLQWKIYTIFSNEKTESFFNNILKFPIENVINKNQAINLEDEVKVILNGSDTGLKLCEELYEVFQPTRCSKYVEIKSNKYYLNNFLLDKQLITLQQYLINKSNYKQVLIDRPFVLKPVSGAGGQNTFYINSSTDLEIITDFQNENFILQEKALGTEYSVDFVSHAGKHKIHAVWKYLKNDNHHHREEIDLINPVGNENLIKKIYDYMVKIFNAIDHNYGPTHSEVIIDSDRINLIEINFRLHGHLTNIIQWSSLGTSQAGQVLKYYNNSLFDKLDNYNFLKPIKKILINNKIPKYITEINWQEIKNLQSISEIIDHDFLIPGWCSQTTSVLNCLGFVLMTNDNIAQFEEDIESVREFKIKVCN